MNTLTTITKLTHAEFNLGVAKIAELAGMSQHMQDKAKDLGSFKFFGQLDQSNRKLLADWLESYEI